MGQEYLAKCPCGFQQPGFLQGCGMAGPDACYAIYQCEKCHRIFHRSISGAGPEPGKKVVCSSCKGAATWLGEELEEGLCQCPACGKKKLEFLITALWD